MFHNRFHFFISRITYGTSVIFFCVCMLFCNIAEGTASESDFSFHFEKKSLQEAIKTLAEISHTEITLTGDFLSKELNSLKFEKQPLPEIIKTILRNYDVENYVIVFENKGRAIQIKSAGLSLSGDDPFYTTSLSNTATAPGEARMFSDDDFARLLKNKQSPRGREFTKEDFDILQKNNDNYKKYREFSSDDFSKLIQGPKLKEYPEFSNDDFSRIQTKSDPQAATYKEFSDKDFQKVFLNQQKSPSD